MEISFTSFYVFIGLCNLSSISNEQEGKVSKKKLVYSCLKISFEIESELVM